MSDTEVESQDTSFASFTSNCSSLKYFPDFHFNLISVTPLSALRNARTRRVVSVLLVVLEMDGPDTIKIKKGPESGREVSILKLTLGDDDGVVCELTAWRDVADTWGGVKSETGVKRGDVIYIENVQAIWEPESPLTMTASSNLRSKIEICYRTIPRPSFPEDVDLQPDLQLGFSDAAVRRVAALVQWFETIAGLTKPPAKDKEVHAIE